jgi:hypothetical protein
MLADRARKAHKRQEQEVLKTADRVVMVSPSWCEDLAELGGRPVDYIPFGFDEADFKTVTPLPRDKFRISHFGTLGIDRNPELLWEILAEIAHGDGQFKKDLDIVLAGAIDYTVFQEIEQHGLKENLRYERQMPKAEVIQGMVSSDMLLLLLNKGFGDYNVKGRIPAKLFEYLGSQRPVLAIGRPDSDVAKILRDTNAGRTVNYEEKEALRKAVQEFYRAWKNREQLYRPHGLDQYNFRNLTGKMAGLLDDITK